MPELRWSGRNRWTRLACFSSRSSMIFFASSRPRLSPSTAIILRRILLSSASAPSSTSSSSSRAAPPGPTQSSCASFAHWAHRFRLPRTLFSFRLLAARDFAQVAVQCSQGPLRRMCPWIVLVRAGADIGTHWAAVASSGAVGDRAVVDVHTRRPLPDDALSQRSGQSAS